MLPKKNEKKKLLEKIKERQKLQEIRVVPDGKKRKALKILRLENREKLKQIKIDKKTVPIKKAAMKNNKMSTREKRNPAKKFKEN